MAYPDQLLPDINGDYDPIRKVVKQELQQLNFQGLQQIVDALNRISDQLADISANTDHLVTR